MEKTFPIGGLKLVGVSVDSIVDNLVVIFVPVVGLRANTKILFTNQTDRDSRIESRR